MDKHSHFGSSGANASSRGNASLGFSSIAATDHASMVSSNSAAGGAILAPPPQSYPPRDVRPDSPALPGASSYDHEHAPGPGPATENPDGSAGRGVVVPSTPPPPPAPRGDSGVSAFSERDRNHLRNISDPATVSTMDGTIVGSPRIAPQQMSGRVASPPIMEEGTIGSLGGGSHPMMGTPPAVVSPPTAGETDGEDYVSSRSRSDVVSPVNRTAHGHGSSSSPARRSIFRESREDMGGAI